MNPPRHAPLSREPRYSLRPSPIRVRPQAHDATPLIEHQNTPAIDMLAGVVNRTVQPFRQAPDPAQGTAGVVAHSLNALLGVAALPEQLLDAALAAAFAPAAKVVGSLAARVNDMALTSPHTHVVPVPPLPPLPGFGPITLAGAWNVLVCGAPAARAGDFGYAPTCGSPFGVFQVFTGSSNVFFGGARAARAALDVVLQCLPGSTASAAATALTRTQHVMAAVHTVATVGGVVAGVAGSLGALQESDALVEEASAADDGADAANAAARATGKALAAAMMAAQTAADLAALALGMMMGRVPGVPGGFGVVLPGQSSVWVGGVPLPSSSEVLRGLSALSQAALRRLRKKRVNDPPHPRRNGVCEREGDPVSVVTGEAFHTFTDLVSDQHFRWTRFQSSRLSTSNGPLGWSMRHRWQRMLRVLPSHVELITHEGLVEAHPLWLGRSRVESHGRVATRSDEGLRFEIDDGRETMVFARDDVDREYARLVEARVGSEHLTFLYDSETDVLLSIAARGEGSAESYSLRYDDLGLLREVWRESAGARTTIARYDYDHDGRMTDAHDALGQRWQYEWDEHNRCVSKVDPNGYRFSWRFDERGRCVWTSGADGAWECSFAYRDTHHTTTVTDREGGARTYHMTVDGFIDRIEHKVGDRIERIDRVMDPLTGRVLYEQSEHGPWRLDWVYGDRGELVGRRDRWGALLPPAHESDLQQARREHRIAKTQLSWQFGEAVDAIHDVAGVGRSLFDLAPASLRGEMRPWFHLDEVDAALELPALPKAPPDPPPTPPSAPAEPSDIGAAPVLRRRETAGVWRAVSPARPLPAQPRVEPPAAPPPTEVAPQEAPTIEPTEVLAPVTPRRPYVPTQAWSPPPGYGRTVSEQLALVARYEAVRRARAAVLNPAHTSAPAEVEATEAIPALQLPALTRAPLTPAPSARRDTGTRAHMAADDVARATRFAARAYTEVFSAASARGKGAGGVDARAAAPSFVDVWRADASPRVNRDALGRMTSRTHADGRSHRFVHDRAGNLIAWTDRDGHTHRRELVSWNLIGREIHADGTSTRFVYDSRGRVTAVVGPGGSTSRYAYDARDRLVAVAHDSGRALAYVFDDRGLLIETRNASRPNDAPLVAWHYDEGHELPIGRTLADGTRHSFEYDARGNLTAARAGWHDVRQTWRDEVSLRFRSDGRRGRDLHLVHGGVEHRYDQEGVLTESITLGSFRTAWTAIANSGVRMVDPTGGVHVLLRDRYGLVLRLCANGVRELSQYAPGGALVARCAWIERDGEPPRLIWQAAHVWSAEGDLLASRESDRGRVRYDVDADHVLRGERHDDGREIRYDRDAAGNLTTRPGVRRMVYGAGNLLRGCLLVKT